MEKLGELTEELTELRLNSEGRRRPRKYYPRDMAFAKPAGKDIVQFLIVGRDEVGALTNAIQIISKHNFYILSLNAQHYTTDSQGDSARGKAKEGFFIISFFASFSEGNATIESIDSQIRSLRFVDEVYWVKMNQSIYDHFRFPPTIFGGKTRVLIFRANSFMSIERKVVESMGSAGQALMFQEGVAYAHETTTQQMAMFPGVHPDVLLDNNFEGLRATGWGIFEYRRVGMRFEVSIVDPPVLEFTTSSSPTPIAPAGFHYYYFISGIIVGMLEKLYSKKFKVNESSYVSQTRKLLLKIDEVQK